ncbi:HAD-IB family phosphatase [Curtobacterium sp. VKM Ac-2865]|uniref:HAD family hydrolase n=1 Tax=Curtobacterium sp. VKM Ac-2865 TaxID=2783817 RepID=UPI00188A3917|nr:HAD-IB family phosphatase [Curtobacterium sp. VKM Ac-2865]MBF4582790.1 HAD-IB family phosphatase [Curtobacterium sp. VKM Ac-2865]
MTTRGIVFVDIDGTLVPSGSSSSFLAARLGHQHDLDQAEARYASGELSNQEVSEIDARGWRGTTPATIDRWLEDLPVIAGIDAVVAWCREHDVEPVLASLAWQPVSAALARRFGCTANGGPRIGLTGGVYDGTVAEHFDEHDKRDRALALAAERGLTPDRCCAVGDSRSDLPLFGTVPLSLALNAGAAARAGATDALDTDDLTTILPWLTRWERGLDSAGR